MYLASLDGLVAEYARRMGLPELTDVEIDDGEFAVALAHVHDQHPEETAAQQNARAMARLLYQKYGVPLKDKGALPAQVEKSRANNLIGMHSVVRTISKQQLPGLEAAVQKLAQSLSAEMTQSGDKQTAGIIALGEAMAKELGLSRVALSLDMANIKAAMESQSTSAEMIAKVRADEHCEAMKLRKHVGWSVVTWLAIIALLLLVFGVRAHAQIDVITFQDAAGTTVKSYAAPFKFKCGTGLTCSASGSTLTATASGGPGAAYYQTVQQAAASLTQRATVNFFGGITAVDNAGNTRTDITLTQNDAVVNQFVTGVSNVGVLIRAQPTWANIDKSTSSLADIATRSHTALSDIGTNTHAQLDTFVASKAAASGLASLDGSSKVIQDPANATATPTASKIPIADGSGKLDGWVTAYSLPTASSSVLGGVKPDGTSILNSSGVLSATAASVGAAVSNAATTVNGQSCALSGNCTVTAAPTAHASTHGSGQSDAITVAESQVTGLTTDLAAKAASNASTTVNGQPCALGGSCTVNGTTATFWQWEQSGITASSTASINRCNLWGFQAPVDIQFSNIGMYVSTGDATNAYYDYAIYDGSGNLFTHTGPAVTTASSTINGRVLITTGSPSCSSLPCTLAANTRYYVGQCTSHASTTAKWAVSASTSVWQDVTSAITTGTTASSDTAPASLTLPTKTWANGRMLNFVLY